MKISIDTLFEDPDLPSSAIHYLVNLVRWLPEVSPQHDFYVLVGPRNRRYFANGQRPNVHLVNCGISNENRALRILTQQSVIPMRMKREKIDVLFAAGNVCPLAGHFCRVLKINTLHHIHTPELIGRTRALYRRFAISASAKRADRILANSEVTKVDICRFLGVAQEKVSVVWEAADEVFHPASLEQKQRLRAEYGLRRDYVLFVSNLWLYKNPDTLLQAFARLAKGGGFDLDLVLVGRDEESYQAHLEELAGSLGIADRTRFLGEVPNHEMPAVYSGARVFVYPSLAETFGKPLVEAMRCRVPIVASNTSSIPEVLGNAGLLVAPRNIDQLSEAIRQAAFNEPLREELIARGVRRAACFSWRMAALNTMLTIERAFDEWKAVNQHGDRPVSMPAPRLG